MFKQPGSRRLLLAMILTAGDGRFFRSRKRPLFLNEAWKIYLTQCLRRPTRLAAPVQLLHRATATYESTSHLPNAVDTGEGDANEPGFR